MKDQNLSLDLLNGLVITWINTSNNVKISSLFIQEVKLFFLNKALNKRKKIRRDWKQNTW